MLFGPFMSMTVDTSLYDAIKFNSTANCILQNDRKVESIPL